MSIFYLFSAAFTVLAVATATLSTAQAAGSYRDDLDPVGNGANSQERYAQVTESGVASNLYSNGGIFDVQWRADHITFGDGMMEMRLDNALCQTEDCGGHEYAGSEWQTEKNDFGYGCYGVRMKTASGSGLLTSLFTFSPGADEIDIEIMGKDPSVLEATVHVQGETTQSHVFDMGFDSSKGFHVYHIDWQENYIAWLVDGKELHRFSGGALPSEPGMIMANVWTGAENSEVGDWFGPREFDNPSIAYYDWISYEPEPCVEGDVEQPQTDVNKDGDKDEENNNEEKHCLCRPKNDEQ